MKRAILSLTVLAGLFLMPSCLAAVDTAPAPAAPSPAQNPVVFNIKTDLNGAVIATNGVPSPTSANGGMWAERYDNVANSYNVSMAFDAQVKEAYTNLSPDVYKQLFSDIPSADVVMIPRASLVRFANAGFLADITDVLLAYGLPEAYYSAGWVNGRIYGFSVKPPVADGFLIYNKELLTKMDINETPGDLFDKGQWDRDAFYDYCLKMTSLTNTAVLIADLADFFLHAQYAGGGYLLHPETCMPMYGAPSVLETVNYMRKLADSGILAPYRPDKFRDNEAVITSGTTARLTLYLNAGMDVGIVPYPWDLGTENYRTLANNADVLAIMKEGALTKAAPYDYIDIMLTYYGVNEEIEAAILRERQGLPPSALGMGWLAELLDEADLQRLEWLYNRPALLNPLADDYNDPLLVSLDGIVFNGDNALDIITYLTNQLNLTK